MDGLRVYWTKTAVRQRDHIFDYWNKRNKSFSYSKKLNLSIREKINLLKFQPELGVKTEFGDTRIVYIGHYSILYKSEKEKLIVTGFWDNRQDPEKLLSFLRN